MKKYNLIKLLRESEIEEKKKDTKRESPLVKNVIINFVKKLNLIINEIARKK